MKFLSRHEYECPYCHQQLQDEVIDGVEKKICRSEICVTVCGEKGRVWECADYGYIGD